jgi:hypothetical protein
MARFYFDIIDGTHSSFDDEGQELPDVEAAAREARMVLADFTRGRIVDDLAVVVRTEEKRLLTVSLTVCVRTE